MLRSGILLLVANLAVLAFGAAPQPDAQLAVSPNPPARPLGWDAPVQITNDDNNDSLAGNGWQVTADVNGNVHVVWVQSPKSSPRNNGVFWKMWDQTGSWSVAKRISPANSFQTDCCYPSIATDSSGNVWFAWTATSVNLSQQRIYVCRWSQSSGVGALDSCSDEGLYNRSPVVQCFRDTVHVLWLGNVGGSGGSYPLEHRAKQIDAGPGQWTPVDILTPTMTSDAATSPGLSVGKDNRLHAVWLSGSPVQVRYRSRIGGVWFPVESCSVTSNVKYDPTVAVDTGGVIHVAWRQLESFGYCQQYYDYRLPAGGWLTTPIRVVGINGEQFAPRISCDHWGNVDLVWYGIAGTSWEIFYCRRTPPGSFSSPILLNVAPHTTPVRPSAASCLYGNLHVVWSDTTGGVSGSDEEIFYRRYKVAHDVGILAINPPGTDVDSVFSVVTPVCTTDNYGDVAETYPVRMRIGAFYDRSVWVSNHPPKSKLQVQFPAYSDWPRGSYYVACSLGVAGDAWFDNDTLSKSITGHVHDVQCDTISAPPEMVDSTEPALSPLVRIRNPGSEDESFSLTFGISDGYNRTLSVSVLQGDTRWFVFPAWNHRLRGNWLAACTTKLANDANRGNDVLQRPVLVRIPDVAVTGIDYPVAWVDSSDPIAPQARVRNDGSHPASFDAWFRFDSTGGLAYNQSIAVSNLSVGVETLVVFPAWPRPHRINNYVARCSVYQAGDVNRANDTLSGAFIVRYVPPPQGGIWTQMADVPPGNRLKKVKDGGALAYGLENGNDTGFVFAFKGNNTLEYYRYNTKTNVWLSRDSIPVFNRAKKKKSVKKGAALTMTTGGLVYAVKGNNTYDLWEYDPARPPGARWTQKADVPTGSRALKEGTGLVAVHDAVGNADYLYLLKGSATTEFYRFDVVGNAWTTLTSPPATGFRNGSCITWDGGDSIFVLRGSTDEFYVYSIAGRSWQPRRALPLTLPGGTRRKKVKDGAGLAYCTRIVYALKGGGTNEFWTYKCDSQDWLVDNPMQPSPMNKTVKGGGALVYAHSRYALYALRGNNTPEFWMYTSRTLGTGGLPLPADGASGDIQERSAVLSLRSELSIAPNPFSDATAIHYSLPRPGTVRLKLYDVSGRLITVLASGYHGAGTSDFELRASDLPKGVYLLRLESRGLDLDQKLVVE